MLRHNSSAAADNAFCGWLSIHNSGQWIQHFSFAQPICFQTAQVFHSILSGRNYPEVSISAALPRCMLATISVCPQVPEQWWELLPGSWEIRIQLAPQLAVKVHFIPVVETSLVCRKSNPHLLCCREHTSRRVCVALWFWGLSFGCLENTAVFGLKKK